MHTLNKLKTLVIVGTLLSIGAAVTYLAHAPIAHASGESYSWLDSSNIQASGGDFVESSVIGEFEPYQDTNDTKYTYKAPFDILVNSEPYQCRITGTAEFTEPNNLKLVVYTGDSAGSADQAPRCSTSDEYVVDGEPAVDLYNNKSLSVSGSRPGSGDSSAPETAAQKTITTYICSYKKDSPKSVKLTLKNTKGEVVQTINGNGQNKEDCQQLYQPSFKDVKPGKYSVCTNLSKECDEIEKIRYKPTTAALYIGTAPESSKNKVVEGSLYIDNPDLDLSSLDQDKSFGTYPIVLLDSSGKEVDSTSVDVEYDMADLCKKFQEEGKPCTVPNSVTGYILFENVPPGKYKVCIENTEKCHSFTKERGTRYRDADIHLSMSEAAEYDTSGTLGSGDNTTSCAVEGVGWIICPVISFMAKLNDEAFKVISGFLEVEPALLADDGAKPAWESFRNLANIAFVIAFLLIIYSQITGAGVSNYGIKKLLPKLVIAAILVNVSYYICQIAVDLSNIIGASIYDFFKDIPTTAGGAATADDLPGWKDVAGKVLAVGAALLAGVLLLSTLGSAALLAFMLVVLILLARKAILILLIVVAPLAFVAYMLPNTNQWFKKWWSLFSKLLMVFPVIGVIFGASFLAARVIMATATGGGDNQIMLQLTALGIMAVPLFAVPVVLKGAMAATGTIGAKLNGWQDKALGAAGGKGKERFGNTAFARGRKMRKEAKGRYRDKKFAEAVTGNDTSRIGRLRARASRGITGRSFTNSGDYAQQRIATAALAEHDKHYEEDVKGASLNQAGLTNAQIANIAATGRYADGRSASEHEMAAATDRIMATGSFDERRAALEHIASNKDKYSESTRNRAVQGAYKRGDQNIYGVDFGNQIVNNSGKINSAETLAKATQENAAGGKVSAEHLVQSSGATKYVVDVAKGELENKVRDDAGNVTGTVKVLTTADAGAIGKLSSAAGDAKTGPQTATKVTAEIKDNFDRL